MQLPAHTHQHIPITHLPSHWLVTIKQLPAVIGRFLMTRRQWAVQVHEEQMDDSVANLAMCPPEVAAAGGAVQRGGERVSLTVRRVAKTVGAFLLAGRR